MEVGRILPVEAAAILNVSPQFVRVAMQQKELPIGTAIRMSSVWTYHISEKLLVDYSGKDIKSEIEKIRIWENVSKELDIQSCQPSKTA